MRNQLKNYLRIFILLLGVSVLLWNCEKESTEYIINDQATISIEKVKEQFKVSFNKTAFSNISNKPYWESAKTFYDQRGNSYIEVPFQILHPEDIEKGTSVSFDKLVAFSDGNTITLNIVHFFGIDTKNNFVNYETITHKELYNFNGFITTYDTNKNVIDIKQFDKGIDTQKKITIKNKNNNDNLFFKADETTEEYCTRGCWYWVYGSGQSRTVELITCSPWSCTRTTYGTITGKGGGGTGAGSSTSYSTTNHEKKKKDEVVPPSCESFDFKKVGSAQFSYVEGIRFLIIDNNGKSIYVKYDEPMEFSAPITDRFGNKYGAGAVAEASANALQEAMDTAKSYSKRKTWATVEDIKRYFEDELKRVYPQHVNGGRAKIRPTTILTYTSRYKTSGISIGGVNFGTDSCN